MMNLRYIDFLSSRCLDCLFTYKLIYIFFIIMNSSSLESSIDTVANYFFCCLELHTYFSMTNTQWVIVWKYSIILWDEMLAQHLMVWKCLGYKPIRVPLINWFNKKKIQKQCKFFKLNCVQCRLFEWVLLNTSTTANTRSVYHQWKLVLKI